MNQKFKSLSKLNLGKVLSKSEAKNAIGGYGEPYYTGPGFVHCVYEEKITNFSIFSFTYKDAGTYNHRVDSCPVDLMGVCNENKFLANRTYYFSEIITRSASCIH